MRYAQFYMRLRRAPSSGAARHLLPEEGLTGSAARIFLPRATQASGASDYNIICALQIPGAEGADKTGSSPQATPLKAVSRQPSAEDSAERAFALCTFKTGVCALRILHRINSSAHQRINFLSAKRTKKEHAKCSSQYPKESFPFTVLHESSARQCLIWRQRHSFFTL